MTLKKYLISTSRLNKKLIVLSCDFFCICIATFFALVLSNVDISEISQEQILRLLWLPFFCVFVFWYLGVYKSIVRYIDFSVVRIIARAILFVFLFNLVALYIYRVINEKLLGLTIKNIISVEAWIAGLITFSFLVIVSRLIAYFYFSETKSEKRVVIYGAGSAGIQLASALRVSSEMQPVAFVDNDKVLHGTFLGGIKVLDPKKLQKLCSRGKVDEVLIAMPSASRFHLKNLLKEIEAYSVKVRILPGLAALAQGKVTVSDLKEVDVMDLLGRTEVEANQSLIDRNIQDKVVLITGAGGSIGSELSRQVSKNGAKKLILLDANEFALYSIKNEIQMMSPNIDVYSILGSVTDRNRITEVCKTFKVQTVYHAAAYKHVPLVEENPFEAVFNNIFGTKICAESAIESNVETFVLISTDKAVRPTNIMGATKRFAELILQALSQKNSTKMIMVRFGNVLGSSGSAIPLFQEQIKSGGPVTVTHPDVVRYFMSIPEAAELVLQAGAMGEGGDVFLLDMGEPVKVFELAKRLISLSGMELIDENNPDGDIKIEFTGLRPGEKLYEELLIGESASETEHKRIFKAKEDHLSQEKLDLYIESLREAKNNGDIEALKTIFQEVVAGFKQQKIVDVLHLQKN